jgi:hypothetical protein
MWRDLFDSFFRPTLRQSRVGRGRVRRTRAQDVDFVRSLLAEGCLPPRRPDRYEASLRRRKLVRMLTVAGLAVFGAWVIIESAQALSMF